MSRKLFGGVLACLLMTSACTTSVGDIAVESDDPAAEDVGPANESGENADPTDSAADSSSVEAGDQESAAASSGDDDDDDVAEGSKFSVLEALALIPESATVEAGSGLQVSVGDVDAAADQARLRRPLDPADSDDLVEFLGPLTGFSPNDRPLRVFVPFPSIVLDRALADPESFIDDVGFSPGEISSFASLEASPAGFFAFEGVVLRGDLPEVAPGVFTIGEGDDLNLDPVSRTAARPLGRPLRVAQLGSLAVLSLTTQPVSDVLDGTGPTLADNQVLGELARRLDEELVVSAFLFSRDGQGPSGIGLGWRADDRGPQGVMVLGYDTGAQATVAFDAVAASFAGNSLVSDEPIANLVMLDEIEVRGSEIVATVDFAEDRGPQVLFNMLIRGDGPFAVA